MTVTATLADQIAWDPSPGATAYDVIAEVDGARRPAVRVTSTSIAVSALFASPDLRKLTHVVVTPLDRGVFGAATSSDVHLVAFNPPRNLRRL